jgi:hypothetical protein
MMTRTPGVYIIGSVEGCANVLEMQYKTKNVFKFGQTDNMEGRIFDPAYTTMIREGTLEYKATWKCDRHEEFEMALKVKNFKCLLGKKREHLNMPLDEIKQSFLNVSQKYNIPGEWCSIECKSREKNKYESGSSSHDTTVDDNDFDMCDSKTDVTTNLSKIPNEHFQKFSFDNPNRQNSIYDCMVSHTLQ